MSNEGSFVLTMTILAPEWANQRIAKNILALYFEQQ
jgi:hypothetical protein